MKIAFGRIGCGLAVLSLFVACLTGVTAQTTSSPAPGYTVVLQVQVSPAGKPLNMTVVRSDDTTGEQMLNRSAIALAEKMTFPVREKNGQAVAYKVQAPFEFPVADDEGPAAAALPMPRLVEALQPTYPPTLAAAGTVGGAILEVGVSAEGRLTQVRLLRASHAEFGEAALAAVAKWTFRAAESGGVPVESRVRLAISFVMDGREPAYFWRIPPRPALGSYTVVRASAAAK
jgi:TonB family protein